MGTLKESSYSGTFQKGAVKRKLQANILSAIQAKSSYQLSFNLRKEIDLNKLRHETELPSSAHRETEKPSQAHSFVTQGMVSVPAHPHQ